MRSEGSSPSPSAAHAACQILRNDGDAAPPADYVERVNRAIDHVVSDLRRPLKLADVARAAHFSPCHFHRIFKSVVGETLHDFVTRQRLERALFLMSHAPGRSLTDVALDCGFASSSDFSRSFKRRHGVPPSAFDVAAFRDERRAEFDRVVAEQTEGFTIGPLTPGENPDGFEVRLRRLPARTVAYRRVLDSFRDGAAAAACAQLVAWAEARDLADGQWLGYMWDDPEIVALADCRYDVAVEVDDVQPEGDVGRYDFGPMQVAEVAVSGDLARVQRALDWLWKTWLPHSGYVPDELPAFEAWVGRPFAHGDRHFEIACQVPVVRA